MDEANVTQHPTRVREKALVGARKRADGSVDTTSAMTMEITTTHPLAGTAGAVRHNLQAEERAAHKVIFQTGRKTGLPQEELNRQAEEAVERLHQVEIEQELLRAVVARANHPSGKNEHQFVGDQNVYWNEVSATDAKSILDEQIIGGEEGLQVAFQRDPNAPTKKYQRPHLHQRPIEISRVLHAAQGLSKRLSQEIPAK